MITDIQVGKQSIKTIGMLKPIIMLQCRQKQTFAEPSRAYEKEVLAAETFHLLDVWRFIDI
jgi:hypothetical protein